MSALITSDLHFNSTSRDAYRFEFMRWFIKQVKYEKATCVFILGDLTDEKDRHDTYLVNRIADFIYELSLLCPVSILYGNHDGVDPTCPFFKFLGLMNGVKYHNVPYMVQYDCLGRVLLLPHSTQPEVIWKESLTKKHDWCFAHATFTGTVAENGHALSGVSTSIFKKNAKVISGDIHIPQRVGCVEYVGAPYRIDFGDSYDPRILQIDGRSVTSIPVPGPKKRLITVSSVEDLAGIEVDANDLIKACVVYDDTDNVSAVDFDKKRKAIEKWAQRNNVVLVSTPMRVSKQAIGKLDLSQGSDKSLVRTFAKRAGLDKPTTKAGLRLMRESEV